MLADINQPGFFFSTLRDFLGTSCGNMWHLFLQVQMLVALISS